MQQPNFDYSLMLDDNTLKVACFDLLKTIQKVFAAHGKIHILYNKSFKILTRINGRNEITTEFSNLKEIYAALLKLKTFIDDPKFDILLFLMNHAPDLGNQLLSNMDEQISNKLSKSKEAEWLRGR